MNKRANTLKGLLNLCLWFLIIGLVGRTANATVEIGKCSSFSILGYKVPNGSCNLQAHFYSEGSTGGYGPEGVNWERSVAACLSSPGSITKASVIFYTNEKMDGWMRGERCVYSNDAWHCQKKTKLPKSFILERSYEDCKNDEDLDSFSQVK